MDFNPVHSEHTDGAVQSKRYTLEGVAQFVRRDNLFGFKKNGVALVRTDVSEQLSPSFIRVTRNGELGTTLAVASNRHTLQINSSQILVTLMK
jgi:hypothetical protein